MKVVYYADDGTEFETYEECLEYEEIHINELNEMMLSTHVFDQNFKPLKIGDNLSDDDVSTMLTHAWYVKFDSEQALNYFSYLQQEEGYDSLVTDFYDYRDNDVLIFDDGADAWISCLEKIEEYQGILKNVLAQVKEK